MTIHTHTLTRRQYCDVELLLNGGFYPLTGFLSEENYYSVLYHHRLIDQSLWPMPIVLDVSENAAEKISQGDCLILCDEEGIMIASLHVTDIWKPDKKHEAELLFQTQNQKHPGVSYLFHQMGDIYLGGPLTLINQPQHFNFLELRHTPETLKNHFYQHKIERIVGFQTRNPMHRAHYELTKRAASLVDAFILIHPSVGETKPGDIDPDTRIKCYQQMMSYYQKNTAMLSLLPLAMRMAGPREALWHALIRQNYGCTHFIIGRDHASPGIEFYGDDAAKTLTQKFCDELSIKLLYFDEMCYVKNRNAYLFQSEINTDDRVEKISGTALKCLLEQQQKIPDWLFFPDIVAILQKKYRSKSQAGFTLFLTGLSGSGKSTLAKALHHKLTELTERTISILDGDIFRNAFSPTLGFQKTDRNENIKRIGIIASEITKHHGIAICALIAPYHEAREWVRNRVMAYGGYLEVYVATPLSICEARDPKGLYQKARKKEITNFTGIDDPYEKPMNPELIIDTSILSVEKSVTIIIGKLRELCYLKC